MCIGMNSKVDDPNRMRMQGSEFYMKTEEEMRALCPVLPEACANTLESRREVQRRARLGQHHPAQLPAARSRRDAREPVRRECERAWPSADGPDWRTREIDGNSILERFEFEYKVICDKGFACVLPHRRRIRALAANGIGVGPGRGSAAGALSLSPWTSPPSTRCRTASCSRGSCPRTLGDARYRHGLRR